MLMTKRQRRSEPLKTVFTETVDEGGWEVDDTLMDENTSTVANVSIQLRCLYIGSLSKVLLSQRESYYRTHAVPSNSTPSSITTAWLCIGRVE